ncbi:IS200/IS605 family element transposase accessory protein TnpB [Candidatus Woesearchaeota archaeon]|nr:IS200/IS605 family element transposase accessory protein TnpB [Candidatus Woesearchaeota archaeon]
MIVRATAKIRIEARTELYKTVSIYQKAMQHCIDLGWEKNIHNNIKLHPFVYQHLRSIGLPAQLAVSCIKQSCGMLKKAKSKPIVKRTAIRYNFPRSATLKGTLLNILTVKGRIRIPFEVPTCYQEYFTWNMTKSLLSIDRKGRCFFLFCFCKEVNVNAPDKQLMLGIDLGINNLAVTSDGTFYRSGHVKSIKRRFQYLRDKLQAKGTRSAKRLLKKVSGREKRFMVWVNHNISKRIIEKRPSEIVMENLKGIRKCNRGKRINRWISNWSFHQLQNFIQYKAERKGIRFRKVKPDYTSQLCSRCGTLGHRKGASFVCKCGFRLNADLNASRNLAFPMLELRQAAVNLPYMTCNETSTSSFSV